MNNSNIKQFYFYQNYIFENSDFSNFQNWIFQSIGNLAAGFSPNNTVLNGLAVTSVSGLVVSVASGTAINQAGQICVLSSAATATLTTPIGNPAYSLVVLRPNMTDSDFIPDPSNPFSGNTVPLDTLLGCSIVVINGTPSGSPVYPAASSTDIILVGCQLNSGATGSVTFDSTQRQIFVVDSNNADATGESMTQTGANAVGESMGSAGANQILSNINKAPTSYTPTFSVNMGSAGSETKTGYFFIIGKIVFVQVEIDWTQSGGTATAITISLPVTPLNGAAGNSVASGFTGANVMTSAPIFEGNLTVDFSDLSFTDGLNSFCFSAAYFIN